MSRASLINRPIVRQATDGEETVDNGDGESDAIEEVDAEIIETLSLEE